MSLNSTEDIETARDFAVEVLQDAAEFFGGNIHGKKWRTEFERDLEPIYVRNKMEKLVEGHRYKRIQFVGPEKEVEIEVTYK